MGSKVLITGGAGFIGTNLAAHYIRRGAEVTILDNFSRAGTELNGAWLEREFGGAVRVIRADITEPSEVLDEAVEGMDVVFHLAAQVAVTLSVADPRHDFEVNALGTFNVLEAVRRSAARPIVIYSSTNKVYGKLADLAIDLRDGRYGFRDLPSGVAEERPLEFYSPYGCSKGTGDQYVLDYARIYGMRTVVFRQSCIYGPHQFGIEDQGWVAWFAIRALQNQPVTIYGDGRQVRDVLEVSDLCAAFDAAVKNIDVASGKAYNIGGGPANTMSLLELVGSLDGMFGRPLQCEFSDWRPGDQLVYVSDIAKAKADLGWQPEMDVQRGVQRMLKWQRANTDALATVLPPPMPRVVVPTGVYGDIGTPARLADLPGA